MAAARAIEDGGEWRERNEHFRSADQGIYGHLTVRNLAVQPEEPGDRGDAWRLWKTVLDACPARPGAMLRA